MTIRRYSVARKVFWKKKVELEVGLWWRVYTPEGKLWLETSNGAVAIDEAQKRGYTLQNLFRQEVEQWVTLDPDEVEKNF